MLTQKRLKEVISYDPDTGVFTWIKATGRRRDLDGKPAGSLRASGYVMLSIDGELIMAQRAAWLYMTGKHPENLVDHINLVKSDNRWSNLRAATKAQNGQNSKARCKSGLKGAYYNEKCNCWYSRLKRRYLGAFPSAQAAHEAYVAAAELEYGSFARAG